MSTKRRFCACTRLHEFMCVCACLFPSLPLSVCVSVWLHSTLPANSSHPVGDAARKSAKLPFFPPSRPTCNVGPVEDRFRMSKEPSPPIQLQKSICLPFVYVFFFVWREFPMLAVLLHQAHPPPGNPRTRWLCGGGGGSWTPPTTQGADFEPALCGAVVGGWGSDSPPTQLGCALEMDGLGTNPNIWDKDGPLHISLIFCAIHFNPFRTPNVQCSKYFGVEF